MADMEQALESVRISPTDSQLNGIHLKDSAEADSPMPNDDPEMQNIIDRVKEMEEGSENLSRLQKEMEKETSMRSPGGIPTLTLEEKIEADSRSVYVGNVDYGSTAEELEHHFHACGSINRVTILCDKYSGHPKGFAYIEFSDKNSVPTAMSLDESVFRGRQIKVMQKRTNRPGISTTNRPPRVGRFRRPFRGTVIYRSPRRSFRYA